MSEGKIKVERRQHPRFSIALKIRYEVTGEGAEQLAQTADISAGGVRVFSNQQVKPGDVLDVSIELGEGKIIEAQAAVVWVSKVGETDVKAEFDYVFGLRFSEITRENSGFVAEFVQKCLLGK